MSNEKKNEKGLITFFDLEKFGFYRVRNKRDSEDYDVDTKDLLFRLNNWLEGKHFQNTVPWGDKGGSFNKIYCQSYCFDEKTGDFVLVLIKSVGAENGGVKGIKINSLVGIDSNDTVTSGDGLNTKEVAWGQVMYYWFIPSMNKMASIRFSDSVSDINGLSKYIREWVKYRCDKYQGDIGESIRIRSDGTESRSSIRQLYKHKGDGLNGKKDNFSFQFRFLAKQLKLKTGVKNLDSIYSQVTHLVFRSTVTVHTEDRRGFTKLMDRYLPFAGFNAPKVDEKTGKIPRIKEYEVTINESPSLDELENIFQEYNEEYNELDVWNNVGLKLNGRSKDTLWLNEYVVKEDILMPLKVAHKDVYSANQIMQKLLLMRNKLTSSFSNVSEEIPSRKKA